VAGKLKLINEYNFATDGTTSVVNFTGLTSSNPYKLIIANLVSETVVDVNPMFRVTKGGSPQSGSNYALVGYYDFFHTAGSHFNNSSATEVGLGVASGFGAGPTWTAQRSWGYSIIDIYGLTDSSTYDWFLLRNSFTNWQGNGYINYFGAFHKVASASDGIQFLNNKSANISNGTVSLYEVLE